MDDILLVDKPVGITSFGVIRQLRRELQVKKMGHAGTLDPRASGLMIVGVGTGTKKLAELIKLDKTYEAEIVLGEQRTTGDMEGEILDSVDMQTHPPVTEDRVRALLAGMVGTLTLPAPVYSAIKKDGQPLYKRARRGEDVAVPLRDMTIHEATLARIEDHGARVHVHVVFHVASGVYIRSLAEEFGARLGVPAVLANLRRTQIGTFSITDARTL